jgi:hypothetical protein
MNETPGSQLRELTPLNKEDNLRRQSVASDCIKVEYFVFGSGRETLLMIPGLGRWAHDLRGKLGGESDLPTKISASFKAIRKAPTLLPNASG